MAAKKTAVPEPKKKVIVAVKKDVKQPVKKTLGIFNKKKKKDLIISPAQFCFWLHDGGAIQSLIELHYAFTKMSAAQYRYHVAKGKNDFAKWTEDILQDKACAEALRKAKNAKEAAETVKKTLKGYDI